jgi:hypothetical protein
MTTDLIGTCAICKRRHANIGWAASERHPVKWECEECLGLPIANVKRFHHMARKDLDRFEQQALEEGGNAGGAFLDSVGKTDLAALDDHEWREFLRRVLFGYADGMREIVSKEVPF